MITFYDIACVSVSLVTRLLGNIEVRGLENLPRTGAVIIAPNHLHLTDPPILGAFLPRKIYYMAKQEAWDHPFLGLLSRWFEAFPVRRGEADRSAYRRALQVLSEGKALGIFPEGHRSPTGYLQPARPGAILLAQRSGAPIVPVGMWGIREILSWPGVLQRRTLHIVVGEPYHPPPCRREELPILAHDLMVRIAALLPPEHRFPPTPVGSGSYPEAYPP